MHTADKSGRKLLGSAPREGIGYQVIGQEEIDRLIQKEDEALLKWIEESNT
ncbi:MAG TPA: hypothetical protein HA257_09440 [Candidatus Methanoperedenaceae archaeon]|nr:hypothetical protein [Candidatus Methanoperedenaceae archaeon]